MSVLRFALAIYIAYQAASDLIGRKAPEHSIPGIVLACVSLQGRDQRNIEGRPFGVGVDACSLRSDCRQGSKPASRRSARASLRVLDCVLAPASVLSSGSWRSPLFRCAQFRFYEFSLVPEVMRPQKNRSASPVARNILARIKERPCGVNFERCLNLSPLRKESLGNRRVSVGNMVSPATVCATVALSSATQCRGAPLWSWC